MTDDLFRPTVNELRALYASWPLTVVRRALAHNGDTTFQVERRATAAHLQRYVSAPADGKGTPR